jgi:hypothetical protein
LPVKVMDTAGTMPQLSPFVSQAKPVPDPAMLLFPVSRMVSLFLIFACAVPAESMTKKLIVAT